jgi:hypothetical protein
VRWLPGVYNEHAVDEDAGNAVSESVRICERGAIRHAVEIEDGQIRAVPGLQQPTVAQVEDSGRQRRRGANRIFDRQQAPVHCVMPSLSRHRVRQKKERLKAGSDWKDQNLVFTSTIGTPVDERNLRREFDAVLTKAKLPRMRIHDLRHTGASLLLAMGSHPKVVQDVLGHAQMSLTLDTYSHLIPGLAEEAAKKMDEILDANPVGVKVGVSQPESTPEAAAIA